MGRERLVGAGILAASALSAIAYALLLYLGYGSTLAIILVSAALYVLLGIVGWIGWTMATTPAEVEPGTAAGESEETGKPGGDEPSAR